MIRSRHRIGLIAGWGDYPLEIARRLEAAGHEVIAVGVRGHADPAIAGHCRAFRFSGAGRMGSQIRYFRRHNVRVAVLAGKIFKARIFARFAWLHHFPDLTTLRYFWNQFISGRERRNDDNMLLKVTRMFGDHGIEMVPATQFAPDLLMKEGLLSGRAPTALQMEDVRMAWELAREMGRLDIGQSVAVKGRAVLAVEAIEGTDECIRRAGKLCPTGGFTVVKVAKPEQDMRFDVPTIGPGTIRTMHESGGRLLVVEAARTILLAPAETAALARQLGITVLALSGVQSMNLRVA